MPGGERFVRGRHLEVVVCPGKADEAEPGHAREPDEGRYDRDAVRAHTLCHRQIHRPHASAA